MIAAKSARKIGQERGFKFNLFLKICRMDCVKFAALIKFNPQILK
ncbi:hypothetical protein CAMRE0001_1126 [Campylobacter rectus RM3267]|uniref:Uncharacterized protein n=1 Tax=Campylobacter rectus RM3267 TaxID=553218 RepID=B9D0C6_CAMRE|nr:hypothetical protein CAMRE0001_1126 [Campylobacter rectus RM3267]